MNMSEHLLSVLAEECAEVAQRVSKALRFGISAIESGQTLTNAQRIEAELLDVFAAIESLEAVGAICYPCDREAIDRKKAKVSAYIERLEASETAGVPA